MGVLIKVLVVVGGLSILCPGSCTVVQTESFGPFSDALLEEYDASVTSWEENLPGCAAAFSSLNHTAEMEYLVKRAIELQRPFTASVVSVRTRERLAEGAADINNPLEHGETVALRNFQEAVGVDGTFADPLALYTTAESCPMCAAAEVWAGISLVVYGTSRPTLVEIGGFGPFSMRAQEVFEDAAASHDKSYPAPCQLGGVLSSETDRLFKKQQASTQELFL
uniref:CMP/dCMP-type deaminase domain-containing protein n=1 Tax=Chromera velia CCMP2878 TaxID=1169474 RepID=A0A0G4FNQ1_9ALVE|eukprot:Cvel_17969.t1-p1 / transcript=Cvel_17969.t1 / gene=Cvel_17969 / organism=Chromera_velia_CCMP2878 / gene_product=hypothetical protein / transcript_product=hypothetical protein / location=Cvel_scaffold1462:45010-45675(-) / protein_length=222 / sequence_SO=supercontig / SO=protein_coding / is_pseudo=false